MIAWLGTSLLTSNLLRRRHRQLRAKSHSRTSCKPVPCAGGQICGRNGGRSPLRRKPFSAAHQAGLPNDAPNHIAHRVWHLLRQYGSEQHACRQTGFSQGTPIQASLDNGLTYVSNTSNPFPWVARSLGPAGGLTNLGQAITFYNPNRRRAYSQRWSLGIQRTLPGQFMLEVDYVGNKAIRLPITQELNNTPAQYLSTSPIRDQATINSLTAQFPNPFQGTNPIYGTTTSRAALLRPFPEFGSVNLSRAPAIRGISTPDTSGAPLCSRIHVPGKLHLFKIHGSGPVPESSRSVAV